MSRHLTAAEIVDAVEPDRAGRPADRARIEAHLEGCAECRGEVEAVAGVLREVSSDAVPEPSPLFWEHFSRRVSEAAREAVPDRPAWWRTLWPATRSWRLLAPVGVAVVALLAVVFVAGQRGPVDHAGREARAIGASPVGQADVLAGKAVSAGTPTEGAADGLLPARAGDESWHVLSALVTETDAEALTPEGPGAADGAVLQLSDEERGELGRLLEAEIDRHRSRVEG